VHSAVLQPARKSLELPQELCTTDGIS